MATNLRVTELDFDQIKNNLKNFLRTQSEFSDFDFEGSGLSVLLDVLAYNTHYNAMAAHLSLNEAFLDSAQIRGNAVSRAKLLGYVPRSILSPRARVNILVDVSSEQGAKPTVLTVRRGTKLSTIVDGEEYQYVVLNTQSATILNDQYLFENIEIAEGTFKTLRYRVDNDIENQKFQLSDKDADASTVRVRVQENEESTGFDIYTKFETLNEVDSSSRVYYLEENTNGFYQIYFGDGVTGRKPINNNIVTLDYVFTNGKESNGANTFEMVDNIEGFSNIVVTTVQTSAGGNDQEGIESIRFNAPLTFTAQNRAVTAEDYRSIIQKEFSNIDSISTWGGESNDPPDFGRVYVSIKPLITESLTEDEKALIKDVILRGKNVVSITPIIVEPNFTFLELDVFFKFNPNLTDRTAVELTSVVRDTISNYNFNNLNKFDGVFRHSQLLKAIDNADPSIQNSTVRPYMFMMINPANDRNNDFELRFTSPFLQSGESNRFILNSTSFLINDVPHFFGDVPITGQSERRVIVYKVVQGENVIVINNAGTLNVEKGIVVLNNFRPDTTNEIRIIVEPNSLDLAPKRNQLIAIDALRVSITPEVDTIALSGSTGTIKYTTTSRLRG
jgi:hypothetical protein